MKYRGEVEDLKRQFVRGPTTQHLVKISASQAAGSTELAWYRGAQSGMFEAYKIIKRSHPKAAKLLLDKTGMNKRGNLVL